MTAKPKNIVLLISDDHGYGDLSAEETPEGLHTPNLDRLRQAGTTFTRGYVTAPICSPSRAGLIAGAHQARWGARWFDSSAFPPDSRECGPQALRRWGYRTGYFGKVHYGPDRPGTRACPENHGFDQSLYGLAALGMGRLHYLSHSAELARQQPEVARVHGTHPLYDNGAEVDTDTHLSQLFADRAIDFISSAEADGAPYFCMVAFNAVHNFTWQLPQDVLERRGLPAHPDLDPAVDDYLDWYDGAISPNLENGRQYYLAQLELMDRHIGRILDAVQESGSAEDTVVVYLTDNGGSTCNFGDNTPLDGTKYTLYEGGIRVPFIVRWPGESTPGERSDALVSALDLMPSFVAEASGGQERLAGADGQDLVPVLRGVSPGHDALYFDTGAQQAVVRPDVKWRRVVDEGGAMREAVLRVEHTDMGQGEHLAWFHDGFADELGAPSAAQQSAQLVQLREEFERWNAAVGSDAGSSPPVSRP